MAVTCGDTAYAEFAADATKKRLVTSRNAETQPIFLKPVTVLVFKTPANPPEDCSDGRHERNYRANNEYVLKRMCGEAAEGAAA